MTEEKKAHIIKLLVFYLGEKITDPEKVLQTIALEADVTRDEVWEVYCEMTEAYFYSKAEPV